MTEAQNTEAVAEIVAEIVANEATPDFSDGIVAAESATEAAIAELGAEIATAETSEPELAYYVPTIPEFPTAEELGIKNRFHLKVYNEMISSAEMLPELRDTIVAYNKGVAEIDPRLESAESEAAATYRKSRDMHKAASDERALARQAEIDAVIAKFNAQQAESDAKLAEIKSVAVKELTGEDSVSDETNLETLEMWQQVGADIMDKADRIREYGYDELQVVIPTGKPAPKAKRTTVKSSGQKGTGFKPRMAGVTVDGASVGNAKGEISALDLAAKLGVNGDDLKAEIMKLSNIATGNGLSNSDRTGWDKLSRESEIVSHLGGKVTKIHKRFV